VSRAPVSVAAHQAGWLAAVRSGASAFTCCAIANLHGETLDLRVARGYLAGTQSNQSARFVFRVFQGARAGGGLCARSSKSMLAGYIYRRGQRRAGLFAPLRPAVGDRRPLPVGPNLGGLADWLRTICPGMWDFTDQTGGSGWIALVPFVNGLGGK